MNFISTFDELNKLYEGTQSETNSAELKEYYDEEAPLGRSRPYGGYYGNTGRTLSGDAAPQWWKDQGGNNASWRQAKENDSEFNNHRNPWESLDEKDVDSEDLTEATDDVEIDIVDDEETAVIPAEEPVVDEPKQVILECDKCGALILKDEADIIVDDESDLVNIEDECKFCEETKGYKIIGTLLPYEDVENEEDAEAVVEDPASEEGELEEILDIKPAVTLNLDGGQGNDVNVL